MSCSFHTKIKLSPALASCGENNGVALTSCGYEIATVFQLSAAHLEEADSIHSAAITKAD